MRMGTLFNLATDARDLLELFTDVSDVNQLVSRLERLKHEGKEETLQRVEDLRLSLDDFFEDTIEMQPHLGGDEDEEDYGDLDRQLSSLGEEIGENEPPEDEGEKEEKQGDEAEPEKSKNDVPATE